MLISTFHLQSSSWTCITPSTVSASKPCLASTRLHWWHAPVSTLFASPSNAALWHKHHFLPSRSMQSLRKWWIFSKAFFDGYWLEKWSVCYGGLCRILAHNRLTEDWSTPWSRLGYAEVSSRAWAIWSGHFRKKYPLKEGKFVLVLSHHLAWTDFLCQYPLGFAMWIAETVSLWIINLPSSFIYRERSSWGGPLFLEGMPGTHKQRQVPKLPPDQTA